MATINYNGMVLEEFTSNTPVFWDTPRKALCWNEDNNHYRTEEYLIGYVPRSDDGLAITDHTTWSHCALLPEKPELRRVTSRELAKWLAQGNGEWCMKNGTGRIGANTNYGYSAYEENRDVTDGILVRKWDDTEWHEPTVGYMNIPKPYTGLEEL